MSQKLTIDASPRLRWRLDQLDARHAHVTVFDRGAHAGTLILDRETWEAMTGETVIVRQADPE